MHPDAAGESGEILTFVLQLILEEAARKRFILCQGDYTSTFLGFIDRGRLPSTLGGELDVTAWLLDQRAQGQQRDLRDLEEGLVRQHQIDVVSRELAKLEQQLDAEPSAAGVNRAIQFGGAPASEEEIMNIAAVRLNMAQLSEDDLRRMGPWLRDIDNVDILRFLRSNPGGDVEVAWEAIQETALWRVAEGIDQLGAEETEQTLFEDGRHEVVILPPDSQGRPVVLYRAGLHVPGRVSSRDYTRGVIRLIEQARRRYSLGVRSQACVLVDRVGSGLANQDPGLLRDMLPVFQRHYPGLVGAVYIAPINLVFYVIWQIASLLIDSDLRSRIHLLTSDYKIRLSEVRIPRSPSRVQLVTADYNPPLFSRPRLIPPLFPVLSHSGLVSSMASISVLFSQLSPVSAYHAQPWPHDPLIEYPRPMTHLSGPVSHVGFNPPTAMLGSIHPKV